MISCFNYNKLVTTISFCLNIDIFDTLKYMYRHTSLDLYQQVQCILCVNDVSKCV